MQIQSEGKSVSHGPRGVGGWLTIDWEVAGKRLFWCGRRGGEGKAVMIGWVDKLISEEILGGGLAVSWTPVDILRGY